MTVAALPIIAPVRYQLDERQLTVCLGDRQNLLRALDQTVVAFEVDSLSEPDSFGWLVHIRGLSRLTSLAAPATCPCPDGPLRATIEAMHIEGTILQHCRTFHPAVI